MRSPINQWGNCQSRDKAHEPQDATVKIADPKGWRPWCSDTQRQEKAALLQKREVITSSSAFLVHLGLWLIKRYGFAPRSDLPYEAHHSCAFLLWKHLHGHTLWHHASSIAPAPLHPVKLTLINLKLTITNCSFKGRSLGHLSLGGIWTVPFKAWPVTSTTWGFVKKCKSSGPTAILWSRNAIGRGSSTLPAALRWLWCLRKFGNYQHKR